MTRRWAGAPKTAKDGGFAIGGRRAVTHYQVLERVGGYTLVRCKLETGRTHQIRVHMKYLGHPLVGDKLYGPRNTPDVGMLLHSARLQFVHPITDETIELEAPLPADFAAFWQSWKRRRLELLFSLRLRRNAR